MSEKLPPQGKVSADWSKTCRQVGSDSSHHSFSRLVQYLPSSRVGFPSPQFQPTGPIPAVKSGRIPTDGRTDGPKYFSSHLMAVLSFSRLVQNSPSSRVGFPSPQFQPTGPIPAVKSGRIPTDGRTKIFFLSPDGSSQFQPTGPKLAFKSGRIPTDGRTKIFFQSPDGSSQFQPTGPKLAFKSGRIPVTTVSADWSNIPAVKSGRIPTDGRTNIFCPVTSWQFSVSAD